MSHTGFRTSLALGCVAALAACQSPPQSNETMPQPSAGDVVSQVAYLKASNTGEGDKFGSGGALEGHAVAMSADGRILAVGAPVESSGAAGVNGEQADDSQYAAGAVYVFARTGDNWTQQAYLKASNPGLGDYFGYQVALNGDGSTLAVSAIYEASSAAEINGDQTNDDAPQAGAVYVFTRSGTNWTQQAYIKAANNGLGEDVDPDALISGDQFGFSLAFSDDGSRLAVGAIGESSAAAGANADPADNSAVSAGAVYIFERNDGRWTQADYLKASNPGTNDYFGYSVDFNAAGTRLAIGAYDEDGSLAGTNERQDDDLGGAGAVYVFDLEGGAWRQTAYLKAANAERNDSLGVQVALSDDGNTLVATALDEDSLTTGTNSTPVPEWESDTSTGAVYVFSRSGEGWRQTAYLKASNSGAGDLFGQRFALSGDGQTLLIGAALEDSPATGINGPQDSDEANEAGSAYVLTRSGDAWTQLAYLKGSHNEEGDEFGAALAVSRDGRVFAVGAHGDDSASTGVNGDPADNSAHDSGAVFVFERN
jgi:hypothetical protein